MLEARLRVAWLLTAVLAMSACNEAPAFVARYEPWRDQEERACLASGLVQETPFVVARASLGGESLCGAIKPFTVAAAAQGTVAFEPPALVGCPMVHALDFWVQRVVLPSARRYLQARVVGIKVAGSYSCRPMNNVDGAPLSEHGHANAIDVSGFVLADGRVVTVEDAAWGGPSLERNFLAAVRLGSCNVFTTVLGPGYNRLHRDHLHLDLARHPGDERVCE
jgi:hypothetical protein